MTLDEARARIGKRVRYVREKDFPAIGEITSVNDTYVFVRYRNRGGWGWETQSKATRPEDLEPTP